MRHPKLAGLCGSDICGIEVTQDRAFAKILLLVDTNKLISIHLSNDDRTPIEFNIGELDLRLITEENAKWVTLGEFEYYHEAPDDWLHLEGDSGLFSFKCTQVIVKPKDY